MGIEMFSMGGEDSANLEAEAWEWFSAALAWTLFTMPQESCVILSDARHWCAQFMRGGDELLAETPSNTGLAQTIHSSADEALLAARGWRAPEGQELNWSRRVTWPARFEEYERLAEQVVVVVRDVLRLWLPLQLQVETIPGLQRAQPDVSLLGANDFAADELRTLPRSMWASIVADRRESLQQVKSRARQAHLARAVLGLSYLKREDIDLLAGSDVDWPGRDRTVDFLGLMGPGHLLALDVALEVEDLDNPPRELRRIDGRELERGARRFVSAMVGADLPNIVAQRPDVAENLALNGIRVDYLLIAVDKNKQARLYRAEAEDDATPKPVDADRLDDVYPLLKPADWPRQEFVPHAKIGTLEEQIVIAYARDAGASYEIITKGSPEAADSEALHRRALRNLAALHYEWETGATPELAFAVCPGKEFSAEQLLDPGAMRRVHRLLRSEEIIVAVPRRTCIYAFPRSVLDNPESTLAMMKIVYYTFADDSYGNAQISALMFVLRDGEPIGFVRP
ncbi:TY-Chap domain-containing protein [Nocardia sp. NPDC004722]